MEDVVIEPSFWSGRRVLVTGHTGFKGAWLVTWLSALGAEVTGVSLPPEDERAIFTAAGVARRCTSLLGDLRDREVVEDVLDRASPSVVLHLAAQSLVRRSYRDPVETFSTNVMGTATLLEGLRRREDLDLDAILVITTDKCYENEEWVWGYRESDPLGGHDPYSASKACQEHVVSAYRRSFLAERGVGIATARAGNVIGGGDRAEDRLVVDAIEAFAAGEPLEIRNPLAIRPWQHVLDPLHGYLLQAQRLAVDARAPVALNFGPVAAAAWPVRRVADHLTAAWGDGAMWRHDDTEAPHEARALRLDPSLATAELSWRPVLDTAAALEWTVRWYRWQLQGEPMLERTIEQIDIYTELAMESTA